MSPKHDSKLNLAVKQMGMRAVKVVEKAAAGGPWTKDAVLRAADWFAHGSKEGGVQRPWPNLAARLRKLATAEATTNVAADAADAADAAPVEDRASATPTDAPERATKTKAAKATRTPAIAPAPAPVAPGGLPFSEFAERYLKQLEATGKARGTVFSYSLDLNIAARHFGDDRDVKTITTAEVLAYFESDAVTKKRGGGGKNSITITKLRRTLRMALAWTAEAGLIAEAPIPVTPKVREAADAAMASHVEDAPPVPKAKRGRPARTTTRKGVASVELAVLAAASAV